MPGTSRMGRPSGLQNSIENVPSGVYFKFLKSFTLCYYPYFRV